MNIPLTDSLKDDIDEYYLELEMILLKQNIQTFFQPIVSLENGEIIGYEALSRGPSGSILEFPDKLFAIAEKYNKTWEIESLCRKKAIQKSQNKPNNQYLFLNIDPHIFKDPTFIEGFTKDYLSIYGVDHTKVVFEITEKTAIDDYQQFNNALSYYKNQGYEIAIDDMGSGYSGLKMLSQTKPNFVKIDMDLIRDINNNKFNQSLIECFVKLSELTNMKLIAEGIETKEELSTLIELGVFAGQGFFLSKPINIFNTISPDKETYIKKTFERKHNFTYENNIGKIPKIDLTFNVNTKCKVINSYLENNDIAGACIIRDNKPVGLIMKHIIDSKLATQYGVSVFSNRPISLIMDNNPIIVDYYTDVSEVSKLAMSRSANSIYDCIIVTKDGEFNGLVTIKSLLEYITTIKYNYAKQLNPLTELPGNIAIQQKTSEVINGDYICCFLYLDLDNFKIYNDSYGFKNGDLIIKFTSKLLSHYVNTEFNNNSFIGHIGGDDFICIIDSTLEKCKKLCESLIENFDNGIIEYFNEKDIENGYIKATDRFGNVKTFPLTALSIAGLYGSFKIFSNLEDIGLYMASIKKKAKSIPGSSYVIEELK